MHIFSDFSSSLRYRKNYWNIKTNIVEFITQTNSSHQQKSILKIVLFIYINMTHCSNWLQINITITVWECLFSLKHELQHHSVENSCILIIFLNFHHNQTIKKRFDKTNQSLGKKDIPIETVLKALCLSIIL